MAGPEPLILMRFQLIIYMNIMTVCIIIVVVALAADVRRSHSRILFPSWGVRGTGSPRRLKTTIGRQQPNSTGTRHIRVSKSDKARRRVSQAGSSCLGIHTYRVDRRVNNEIFIYLEYPSHESKSKAVTQSHTVYVVVLLPACGIPFDRSSWFTSPTIRSFVHRGGGSRTAAAANIAHRLSSINMKQICHLISGQT